MPRPPHRKTHQEISFSLEAAAKPVVIDDPATLKVLYEPLRFEIVAALDKTMSVNELANALGTPANRLYYHVGALERHGLIRIGEERRVGSNLERAYVRAAERFVLSDRLARTAAPASAPKIRALEDLMQQYSESFRAVERRELPGKVSQQISDTRKRMSHERVEELTRRLHELTEEFFGGDVPEEEGLRYGLFFALAPFPDSKTAGRKRKPGRRPPRKGRRR